MTFSKGCWSAAVTVGVLALVAASAQTVSPSLTNVILAQYPSYGVTSRDWDFDGHQLLFIGGLSGVPTLWDIQTGAVLQTFKGHTDEVTLAALSPESGECGQDDVAAQNVKVRSVGWAKVFAHTQSPEDLRKALESVEEPLWDGPAAGNAQGGVRRSVKKLDASYEQGLGPWLEFYAALDNVEAAMRERKMPMPVTPEPQPARTMDVEHQKAYENALQQNEDARIYWTKLSQLAEIRHQASSFFWTWAGGTMRNEPEALKRTELEALTADCLPARVAWIKRVLESTQGTFPPSDDGIQNEKPVKRYAPVGFPQYGTFKDADPRVTHDVTLRVSTRALTSREHGLLVLRLASDSLKTVTLKVGREEFTGIEVDEITQERGNATVTQMVGLSGSIVFDTETIGI